MDKGKPGKKDGPPLSKEDAAIIRQKEAEAKGQSGKKGK